MLKSQITIHYGIFTFKVLDDGSVVHINKTTIADTDDNGNSFFFHRAVIHNIGNPDSEVVDTTSLEDNEEESQGNRVQRLKMALTQAFLIYKLMFHHYIEEKKQYIESPNRN